MRRRTVRVVLSCLAFLVLSHRPLAGGEVVVTPLQTQSTSPSGVLVATNWDESTAHITNPLSFDQFDPKLGSLSSIDVTLTTNIRNDYKLIFVKTPIPTTIFVATSQTTNPSVLAGPTTRASLTDGPTVTLFGPDRTTQIFGTPATRQPVDFVQMTESSGTWSSLLPITNPNYIPPTVTHESFSLTLTAADAPSLFSDFIGTGNVDLPVAASAFSSFYSSSGNGGGVVLTTANAVVTVQYVYVSSVPEPASGILLALGIGIGFALIQRHRRLSS
jgi:PEP-CTERM motif